MNPASGLLIIVLVFLGFWAVSRTKPAIAGFSVYTNRYNKDLYMLTELYTKWIELKAALNARGIDVEMTDAWRGEAEQNQDYQNGVSHATWGNSAHNFGAAFDCAFVINGTLTWPPSNDSNWIAYAQEGYSLGLTWGGDFSTIVDNPHMELPNFRTYALQPAQPSAALV